MGGKFHVVCVMGVWGSLGMFVWGWLLGVLGWGDGWWMW